MVATYCDNIFREKEKYEAIIADLTKKLEDKDKLIKSVNFLPRNKYAFAARVHNTKESIETPHCTVESTLGESNVTSTRLDDREQRHHASARARA